MTRRSSTGWWRQRGKRWTGALWPVVVVTAVLTVEVRFLARSSWRPVVRYDGDSLTFPILWHALSTGEPMHPVLSPQLLLFPEGVIYAVAHFCTTSVGASIVAVAYINVALFYLGLRAVAAVVVDGSALRRRVAALVPTLLLIAAMLLERVAGINTTTIVTPLLFDSFYAGVILIGIATVAFAARQLRWPATRSPSRRLIASTAPAGVLAMTMISDPLFLVQVTAPFVLVVVALWSLRLISPSKLAWLIGPQVGAVVIYKALTPLYKRYLGETSTTYIRARFAGNAYRALDRDLHLILRSTAGRAELSLVAGAWLVGLVTTGVLLDRARKLRRRLGRDAPPTGEAVGRLLVAAFALVGSVSIIAIVIAVGEGLPRYLLPVMTFPFVALVPVANARWPPRVTGAMPVPAATRLALATGAIALTVLGATAVPGAVSILRPGETPVGARYGTTLDESCLEHAFDDRPANGVAAYWTARALDLYNPDHERILQVELDERVFPWLTNLGAYEHRDFTFVLVDKYDHLYNTLRARDVARLGPPARIVGCPDFDIYTYPPGGAGYGRLNTIIDTSLQTDLRQF